jgi:hypothetical protein
MTCRIYTIDKSIRNFVSLALTGHRDYIINAWFSADMKNVSQFDPLQFFFGLAKKLFFFLLDLFY